MSPSEPSTSAATSDRLFGRCPPVNSNRPPGTSSVASPTVAARFPTPESRWCTRRHLHPALDGRGDSAWQALLGQYLQLGGCLAHRIRILAQERGR
jgi:hypothetical protein